jgi:hypothetical protein
MDALFAAQRIAAPFLRLGLGISYVGLFMYFRELRKSEVRLRRMHLPIRAGRKLDLGVYFR